jgi:rhamnogalacturonyl hydrolase YesR
MKNSFTIESVRSEVAAWRAEGGRRLPSGLWQQILALKESHSYEELSAATGFSKSYLNKRLGPQKPGFIEVRMPTAEPASGSMLEIRRPDGTEVRVRFSSQEATAFLSGWLR